MQETAEGGIREAKMSSLERDSRNNVLYGIGEMYPQERMVLTVGLIADAAAVRYRDMAEEHPDIFPGEPAAKPVYHPGNGTPKAVLRLKGVDRARRGDEFLKAVRKRDVELEPDNVMVFRRCADCTYDGGEFNGSFLVLQPEALPEAGNPLYTCAKGGEYCAAFGRGIIMRLMR